MAIATDEMRSGKRDARQRSPSQRLRAETSTEFKNEEAQVANKSNTEAEASQALGAKICGVHKMVMPTLMRRTRRYDGQELGGLLESCYL